LLPKSCRENEEKSKHLKINQMLFEESFSGLHVSFPLKISSSLNEMFSNNLANVILVSHRKTSFNWPRLFFNKLNLSGIWQANDVVLIIWIFSM